MKSPVDVGPDGYRTSVAGGSDRFSAKVADLTSIHGKG